MITLRPALKEEILQTLDNTSFGKDLFNVNLQNADYLIQVIFIPNGNFIFTIKEIQDPKTNKYFNSFESPGDWKLEEEIFEHEQFIHAKNRIHTWANRIEQDYKANLPNYSGLEELRQKILNDFATIGNQKEIHFSDEDKEGITKKLNDLENKIETLFNEKEATRHQINLMKQQISRLKESVKVLDKRTWLLAAANRIINIFKEVKAAVNEVTAITKDFQTLLPQETTDNEMKEENIK